jgi:hypothetical protein
VDEKLAAETITAAHEAANPLDLVNFSGGEPFLEMDLLRALIKHAASLGVRSGVVSNAYWARSPELARASLEELYSAGLRVLTTSLDTFHLDFGSSGRVANALRAASALGMETHLNVVVKRHVPIRAANAHEVLGMDRTEMESVQIHELGPTLVGFAADRLNAADVHRDSLHVIGERCRYVLRSATLTPDGSLYGCCGVGGATDHGPAQLLRIGSLLDEPLPVLLARNRGNLLCHIIAREGPHRLIELARAQQPSLAVRDRYSHICDVCHEITHNQPLQAAVADALNQLVADQHGQT